MMEIKASDGQTIAIIVKNNFNKPGINFISEPNHPLQVGINSYRKEESIKPHIHLNKQITIEKTQEVIYIKTGKARLNLYDSNKNHIKDLTLSAGDLAFFVSGGHGLKIIENTTIIEVKQGPYQGNSKDKTMIASP